MFFFLNRIISSACSRGLPFILSHMVAPKLSILLQWFPTGYLLFPLLPLWIPTGPCTSTVGSTAGVPLFWPLSPYEFPHSMLYLPCISTLGSPCVYLTISLRVRPSSLLPTSRRICPFSPVHPQTHRCHKLSITWLPRTYVVGAPLRSAWVPCDMSSFCFPSQLPAPSSLWTSF